MKTKVLESVARYSIPLDGREIIVAVSGGSDSMALLHLLVTLRSEYHLTLRAAHVNHGIRGEDAQRDERLVRRACLLWGVPLAVLRADVPALAKKSGEGLEECGRRIRYAFFESLSHDALIATAHHAEDAAESFLLHLARGCGLGGLTGIAPVRGRLIRPLIDCEKAEIYKYCRQNNIPFSEDQTNADETYARNRLRRRVLPQMEEINPAFLRCFSRAVFLLREDEECLSRQCQLFAERAKTEEGYRADALLAAPKELRHRLLFFVLRDLSGTIPETTHVFCLEKILTEGGSVTVPGGRVIQCDKTLVFLKKQQSAADPAPQIFDSLPEKCFFGRKEITFSLTPPEKSEKNGFGVFQYSINYDRIIYPVTIRARQNGDFFRPAGRGVKKTLRQLFREAKIPVDERVDCVLLCDRNGIFLAEGFGVDERVKCTGENRLYITIRRNEHDGKYSKHSAD